MGGTCAPCMPSGYSLPSSGGAVGTAAINAIANQTAFGSVALGLVASEVPTAFAWEVNGSTAGISDPAATTPTFTFTEVGNYTVTCTVTIDGQPVIASPVTFEVGTGQGRLVISSFNLPYIGY